MQRGHASPRSGRYLLLAGWVLCCASTGFCVARQSDPGSGTTDALASVPRTVPRPNILFIMSDDHTTQAIGAYGQRLAALNPTPQIDALAENGMRFERVFCNNSICTPSRASILTGQYPQRNGVLDLHGSIGPKQQYLPIELKGLGYETAVIGKWHLKKEPAAFDYYCVLPGQGSYFDPQFCIRGEQPWPKNTFRVEGKHSSDAITDFSLEWLEHQRDKTKPFFLMHHFKAPHDLFEHAGRYDAHFESVQIPEPENLLVRPDASEASRGMGSGLGRQQAPWKLADKLGIPSDLEDPAYARACYQRYLKRYLRCVKGVDDNVTRLINYLRTSGELENTLIVYTSDQGFLLGEHDLMDKRWMYEESIRMPCMVHWPASVAAGSVNRWMISNADFAPTLLDLAGIEETPGYMQGRSFAAALRGEPQPDDWPRAIYYRYWMHLAHCLQVPAHFGIRTERYKLIFFYACSRNGKQQTPVAWEFTTCSKTPAK